MVEAEEAEKIVQGKEVTLNIYISATTHISYQVWQPALTDSLYKSYKNVKTLLYLIGKVKYTSLGTNKTYFYRFVYRLELIQRLT